MIDRLVGVQEQTPQKRYLILEFNQDLCVLVLNTTHCCRGGFCQIPFVADVLNKV